MYQKLAILGSTGSIGRQTLAICRQYNLQAVTLACFNNWSLLLEQVAEFRPSAVALCCSDANIHHKFTSNLANFLSSLADNYQPQVFLGTKAACELANYRCDLAVGAISGLAGLEANLAFLNQGIDLALANKESIVCAGHLLDRAMSKSQAKILPIDSEHAAISECLKAGERADLKKIWLTASGGPFRTWSMQDIYKANKADALAHPTWQMGAKITIDSATMMNKGLEMIEAAYLFKVKADDIQVVVHPQSIIHSAVEWQDGQVTAELSFPNMEAAIKSAIFYPHKVAGLTEAFNFFDQRACNLTFYPPDLQKFPCLALAKSAMINGGIYPLVLNAANEEAVQLFLEDKVCLGQIAEAVEAALEDCDRFKLKEVDDLPELFTLDQNYRKFVRKYLNA